MPAEGNFPPRMQAVDGLRGIAVLLVLLYHFVALQLGHEPGTWHSYLATTLGLAFSGVDLFFVISGFLICGILLDNRTATNYFSVFYFRRSLRIIPPYYLFLLLCWWLPGQWSSIAPPSYPLGGYLTFLCNIWMGIGGWDAGWPVIAWSLAVEEQFYLIFPLVVRLCSPALLLKLAIAAIEISPALRMGLLQQAPSWPLGPQVFTPGRMDCLAFGVIVAIINRREDMHRWLQPRPWLPLLVALAMCPLIAQLILSRAAVGSMTMSAYGYSVLALFYSAVLLTVTRNPDQWLGRLCQNRMLVFVGGISYFVYLFQGIVGWAVFRLFGRPGISLTGPVDAGLIALTLLALAGLGLLSWRVFESPLIAWGKRKVYVTASRPVLGFVRAT